MVLTLMTSPTMIIESRRLRTVSRWSHVSQVEPELRLGGRRGLGLFLFRLLGFAVSALLTFCHRNPPLNEARGCEPGVTRDGRVLRPGPQFSPEPPPGLARALS